MEIKNISYNNIFNNVNMSFTSSNIYGIVGKGKSTLFNIINQDIIPTNGKITNVKNMGYLKQNVKEMFFNDTVYNEIKYRLRNKNYKDIDKKIKDSLLLVDLDVNLLNMNPDSLSSVESRKLGLCCVLISNPKVILLDEPVIGFDKNEKLRFINLLKKLKKRYNKLIIVATNDTDFLHKLVDYVYVLNEGKVVLEGDKYTVFKGVKKYGIKVPKEIEFSNMVKDKKNIKIGYRDDINDLIKDIYRFVK